MVPAAGPDGAQYTSPPAATPSPMAIDVAVPVPIANTHKDSHAGHVDLLNMAWTHFWGRVPTEELIFLYVFGGLPRDDSIDYFVRRLEPDATVLTIDIELGDGHDLACDTKWEFLVALMRAKAFKASLLSPPCCTFSVARKHGDGGPPPLRGCNDVEIYGLRGLTPAQTADVRLGTLLAVRTAEALTIHVELLIPFIYETPAEREGKPHMTKLPEFKPILDNPEVTKFVFDQCTAGARGAKSTLLLLFRIKREEFAELAKLGRRNHLAQWWTIPWSGVTYSAPHPSLRGRQWAIPYHTWNPSMRARYEPSGPYITREMAAYPTGLNEVLARWFCDRAERAVPSATATSRDPWIKVGAWSNALVRSSAVADDHGGDMAAEMLKPVVHKKPRLRRELTPVAPSGAPLGGMRRAAKAVDRLGIKAMAASHRVRLALFEWLARSPSDLRLALDNVGRDVRQVQPELVVKARDIMCDVLKPTNTEPSPLSEVYAGILGAWRLAACDPDDLPEVWLEHGAPGGVSMEIEDRGVFQP